MQRQPTLLSQKQMKQWFLEEGFRHLGRQQVILTAYQHFLDHLCRDHPPRRDLLSSEISQSLIIFWPNTHMSLDVTGPVQSLDSKGELALWLESALQASNHVISCTYVACAPLCSRQLTTLKQCLTQFTAVTCRRPGSTCLCPHLHSWATLFPHYSRCVESHVSGRLS